MDVLIATQVDREHIRADGVALVTVEDVKLAMDASPAAAEGKVFVGNHILRVLVIDSVGEGVEKVADVLELLCNQGDGLFVALDFFCEGGNNPEVGAGVVDAGGDFFDCHNSLRVINC